MRKDLFEVETLSESELIEIKGGDGTETENGDSGGPIIGDVTLPGRGWDVPPY